MPKNCCVVGCTNNSAKRTDLSFYMIPSEATEPDRREKWLQAIGRIDASSSTKLWRPASDYHYLCSSHFIEGKKNNSPAHPDYIPSIFPQKTAEESAGSSKMDHYKRAQKRKCTVLPGCLEQLVVVKEEDPADWSSGLSPSNPALLHVKEAKEDQGEAATFSNVCVKHDEDEPQSSQLHRPPSAPVTAGSWTPATGIKKVVIKQEDLHDWSSSLEPELRCMKEEGQPAEQLGYFAVTVKSEDEDEELHSSQLRQTIKEEEPLASCSFKHAGSDEEFCGGPEHLKNPPPGNHFQPNVDEEDSDFSETDVSDEDDGNVDSDDDDDDGLESSHSEAETFDCSLCVKQSVHQHITVQTEGKLLICRICGESFAQKLDFKMHTRLHRGEKPFGCGDCGKTFRQRSQLKVHVRVHTGEKPFSCSFCGRGFKDSSNLSSHMRVHTGEKPFNCDVCGKTFKLKSHVKAHMSVHTGEKPFTCSFCGRGFSVKTNLDSHMRNHTGEKPFDCDVCGRKFKQKSHMKSHMNVHTGEKPFDCKECGKRFTQKCYLKSHMRVHTTDTPYGCDVCGKAFKLESYLHSHMRVHTGEKPFDCDVCQKKFTLKKNLQKHMSVHTGEKPFSCSVCGKGFSVKTNLDSHTRVHTGEKPFECETCGKKFRQKSQMKVHMSVHAEDKPFSCDKCGKRFTRNLLLNRHMKTHTA